MAAQEQEHTAPEGVSRSTKSHHITSNRFLSKREKKKKKKRKPPPAL